MTRKFKGKFLKYIIIILGLISLAASIFLFVYIFAKGARVLSSSFITGKPKGIPLGSEGGIGPAITGSLSNGVLSQLISGFFGIGTGLYLAFYNENRKLKGAIHLVNQVLSGVPSIIYGLVTYTVFIFILGQSRSLLVASISIAVMTLPFISLRAKKLFIEKGRDYYIQGLNLGLSREYTIRRVVIPNVWRDIVGIMLLSMAYGMGATAPIMYTGVVINAGHPKSIFKPFMSLPYHLYILVTNGISQEQAYGTAAVLMALLLLIQLTVRSFSSHKARRGKDDRG